MVESSQPTSTQDRSNKSCLVTAQLIFSSLVTLVFFVLSILIIWQYNRDGISASMAAVSNLAVGLSFLNLGCFSLISALLSFKKLTNKLKPTKAGWMIWGHLILFLLTLLGFWLGKRSGAAGNFQALIVVLGVTVPIIVLLKIGIGENLTQNPDRSAGLLTLSIGFTTWLILFLELVVLIVSLVFLAIFMSLDPVLWQQIQALMQSLQNFSGSVEALLQELLPLLKHPLVIGSIAVLFAVVVPFIEELFKTLGVWFLYGRGISAQEGFKAGAISGAGFALLEGMFSAAQSLAGVQDSQWFLILFARMGASLVHIFTGAWVGWALAKTWQDKKIWRAILVYLVVMILHGLWNALAVIGGVIPFLGGTSSSVWAYVLLGMLAAAISVGFLSLSNRVRAEENYKRLLAKEE